MEVLLSRHSVALETMRQDMAEEEAAVLGLQTQQAIHPRLLLEDLVATAMYQLATHT
jgi:hypothetical protein